MIWTSHDVNPPAKLKVFRELEMSPILTVEEETERKGSVHERYADLQEEESIMTARSNSIITQKDEELRREYCAKLEEYTESLQNEFACQNKKLEEKNSENRDENTFSKRFENVESYSTINSAAIDTTETNSMKIAAINKEMWQLQNQLQG
ncbi:hypothetical protein SK128_006341 [Halocaridina rubra]|uniref:Uncharacterized protein n=1 Tax=Halocaridina rubra TaxID=373956 RepID=A0AAN9A805_HALRR